MMLTQMQSLSFAGQPSTAPSFLSSDSTAARISLDHGASMTSAMIERGKLFRTCVAARLPAILSSSQNLPQELQNQMQHAIERRLKMSDVAQKCGGHHLFKAAAAATVEEYVKWATEELNRDDGGVSKVRDCLDTRGTSHTCRSISQSSQVLIIKTSNDAGLGNRLQAMTSAFLFAIISKRLLLVDWAENMDTIVCALFVP